MPTLRPYQLKLRQDINAAWAAGAKVPLVVSPTGSGKTVTFSDAITAEPGAVCAIAHRREIVTQISLALARNGVRHRIIGQDKTRKACQRLHVRKLKRHFIDPNSRVVVAGVDTLIGEGCQKANASWFPQVRLWVGDEGHHFLKENKWGKAVALFPNARGLLVTATPLRADGQGLGAHNDGVADALILGPTMRECINMGYLVPYRVVTVQSDVDVASVAISAATGDFNLSQLRDAFHKSKSICGDIVAAWQKHGEDLQTVVFAVDVEEATKTAAKFREFGIPAEVVSAETDEDLRQHVLDRFEAGRIRVLINVDLFGEGFDLPDVGCVVMARHTESFSLYSQQWGRGTRLKLPDDLMACWDTYTDEQRRALIAQSEKPYMILIDMVGNFIRHNGPPDRPRVWSLERPAKRGTRDPGVMPYRICLNPNANNTGLPCAKPYERFYKCCPFCNYYPQPAARSTPEMVDGDLTEVSPEILAAFWAKQAEIDGPPPAHGTGIIAMSIAKNHRVRQEAQQKLRGAMAWWSGLEAAQGFADLSQQYRRFYFTFGTDVATATTLGRSEADELRAKICDALAQKGIDGSVSIG